MRDKITHSFEKNSIKKNTTYIVKFNEILIIIRAVYYDSRNLNDDRRNNITTFCRCHTERSSVYRPCFLFPHPISPILKSSRKLGISAHARLPFEKCYPPCTILVPTVKLLLYYIIKLLIIVYKCNVIFDI